jgi:hypothetical protein
MRQILLIGIGQTGSIIAESFLNKMNKRGVFCRALAIDTDIRALSEISGPQKVYMVEDGSIEDVVKKLGEKDVMRYFPCDWENDRSMLIKGVDMRNGANLWRMKAFLAFNSFLSDTEKVAEFYATLDAVVEDCKDGGEIELYTAASLAGGTGSGLLLPVVLYVKRYLKEKGVKTGDSAYIIGGGAKSKVWRQIVADALNLTLVQTENNDSSFGSAMCAGISAGFFADFDEASNTCRKVVGQTNPIPENTEKYGKIFKKYKKISQFLTELSDEK